jgi:AcrR family transcriptional regulator
MDGRTAAIGTCEATGSYTRVAMPTKKSAMNNDASTTAPTRHRRPRGEPRRLLIAAAQDVFNRKGYSSTSTREIADTAEVSETLMFRYFGSKAGLFREAIVQPFIELVDRGIEARLANPNRFDEPREEARKLVAEMYDLFRTHRALAALLFAADAMTESELAESGVLDEVRAQVERLVEFGTAEAQIQGAAVAPGVHDLTTRATIAMVAGMATFGTWYYGKRRPSRDVILDEITDWVQGRFVSEGPAPKSAPKTKAAKARSPR